MTFFSRFKNVFRPNHIIAIQKENTWEYTKSMWFRGAVLNASITFLVTLVLLGVSAAVQYNTFKKDIAGITNMPFDSIEFTISDDHTLSSNIKTPLYYTFTNPQFGSLALLVDTQKSTPYHDKTVLENDLLLFFGSSQALFLTPMAADESAATKINYSTIKPHTFTEKDIFVVADWLFWKNISIILLSAGLLWLGLFLTFFVVRGILAFVLGAVFWGVFKASKINLQFNHTMQATLQALVPIGTIEALISLVFVPSALFTILFLLLVFAHYFNALYSIKYKQE
jgi:hypothetical protein